MDTKPELTHTSGERTILLIEDDPTIRTETLDLLEAEGYRVTPAGNGLDALLILKHESLPDLILLDLVMPLMSGWELAAELARDERLARIPVVVFSGLVDDREAAHLGIDPRYCVRKPFRAGELLSTVRRCLAERGAPRARSTASGSRRDPTPPGARRSP